MHPTLVSNCAIELTFCESFGLNFLYAMEKAEKTITFEKHKKPISVRHVISFSPRLTILTVFEENVINANSIHTIGFLIY